MSRMEWKVYLSEFAAQTRRQESGIWIWNMDGSFCKRDAFQQIKFDNKFSFLLLSLNDDFWLIGMLSCLVYPTSSEKPFNQFVTEHSARTNAMPLEPFLASDLSLRGRFPDLEADSKILLKS